MSPYVSRYDSYDSLVVVAKDKESAKVIHPKLSFYTTEEATNFASRRNWESNCWVHSPEEVNATLIGLADPNLNTSYPIVISSYNAG